MTKQNLCKIIAIGAGPILPNYQSKFKDLASYTTKSFTLNPKKGDLNGFKQVENLGMLNWMGLPNKGLIDFCINEIPKLKQLETNVFLSLVLEDEKELVEIKALLEETGASKFLKGVELNLGCPNHQYKEIDYGKAIDNLQELLPVRIKLPRDEAIYDPYLKALDKASGIVCFNSVSTPSGALSGHPIALLTRFQVEAFINKYKPKQDIIVCGGVNNLEQVQLYVKLGCKEIQIVTEELINPGSAERLQLEYNEFTNIVNEIDDSLEKAFKEYRFG